jgi:hypothetical protein
LRVFDFHRLWQKIQIRDWVREILLVLG